MVSADTSYMKEELVTTPDIVIDASETEEPSTYEEWKTILFGIEALRAGRIKHGSWSSEEIIITSNNLS